MGCTEAAGLDMDILEETRHRNPKQFITRVEINGAELNRENIQ